ncbi:MAG: hypothetical protein GXO30_03145 [Epsilonproteobacteria bacterium]|nr:hypothetical protein [Campylobacterota bacterium]
MLYRQEISKDISKLDVNSSSFKKEFEKVVRYWYAKALEEAKATGHSIESITYDILEGIEDGLKDSSFSVEDGLSYSVDIMVDLLHHSALLDIAKYEKRVYYAQEALKEKLTAEKSNLLDTLETFKVYAKDNNHLTFESCLRNISLQIDSYIKKLKG